MIDITGKQSSLRTAAAEGRVFCDDFILERVRANTLPKGDLFNIARAAAYMGAKQTANLIPHCHPVSIDALDISFETREDCIAIHCSGKSIGRTGIEMEVLTAVSTAALVIYDLLKPVKNAAGAKGGRLEIGSIRLLEKKGGRSDHRRYAYPGMTAAILVASDGAAAGKREDKSGQIIEEMLSEYGLDIKDYVILADEEQEIRARLREWVGRKIDFIFTTGGTGLGPRDITVEAVRSIAEREVPGVAEAMRAFGQERTPLAMLSRSLAAVAENSIIITLPGSSAGARESLQAILPAIFHGGLMLRGDDHEGTA